MTDRAAFGLELRRLRERRGLSLDQLAEVTKISASLFAGLERGDLSRWPSGIFRRAFVRSYAQAIGLDCEEIVSRFVRLFPDDGECADGHDAPPAGDSGTTAPEQPRLVLDDTAAEARPARSALRRCAAAATDLAIAAVPGAILGALFGWHWFWLVAAIVGAIGHAAALSLVGATPGSLLFLPRRGRFVLAAEASEVVRRRPVPDPEPQAPSARRRVPRHASGTRQVASRSRHVQH